MAFTRAFAGIVLAFSPFAGGAFASEKPVSFRHEVVPVFSKYGCNGGGCHGKAEGQNGFKLSLMGFEPQEDYEHLVVESRGRRLMASAPEYSLLLRKATGDMPHGGGARMEKDSADFKLLVRWMEQGMPNLRADDTRVVRIEVAPREIVATRGAQQQIKVMAHFTDGSSKDVTALSCFETNAKEMAEARNDGLVKLGQLPGDAAVMVRYQEHVDVFRATIPLGAPVGELPPARNFIDTLVFEKLKTLGMPPSTVCDDATFIRRVTLDLAGRLPSAEESTAFLADATPGKRDALIERLLASDDYADWFANKWAALLRNKRRDGKDARGTLAFHGWVREHLRAGTPYKDWVGELLTATGTVTTNPATAWYRAVSKPQDQLQDVAQLFAGTRLQCAQCHHHPFEKWSQQDYYGFAAFFSTLGTKRGDEPAEPSVIHQWREASAQNPRTGEMVKPTVLGGKPAEMAPENDPRALLAEWLTADSNPFFARMLANRYWKHFFSRALVEPEDDIRATNPASNPPLLDALAKHFTEKGMDLREMCRVIVQSTTYQLAAAPNEHNAADNQNFSRFQPRRIPAEVLLDALDSITGVATRFKGMPQGTRAVQLPDDSFNESSYFLSVFGRPDNASACECERVNDGSLAQRLHLLNSKSLQEKLASAEGRASKLATDTAPITEKLQALYMAALSRPPSEQEVKMAGEFLAKKPDKSKEAWEDVIWALVNTKEFLFQR